MTASDLLPEPDPDNCPVARADGYAPTCGAVEADHFGHQCPEENDVIAINTVGIKPCPTELGTLTVALGHYVAHVWITSHTFDDGTDYAVALDLHLLGAEHHGQPVSLDPAQAAALADGLDRTVRVARLAEEAGL